MQAVCNISQQTDEFIKDYLISYEKVSTLDSSIVLVGVTTPYPPSQLPTLVHELLAAEIWREKVFPLMLEKTAKPRTSFPAYLVVQIFTVLNLIYTTHGKNFEKHVFLVKVVNHSIK